VAFGMYMPRFNADVQKPEPTGEDTMSNVTTTNNVTAISENPKQPQQPQQPPTAREIVAANVKELIAQLEAGRSHALTAYLDAMSRFHNYSFGNVLEIARQRAVTYCYTSLESINMRVCASLDTHDGARRPV
jgi:hypothetical protein